MDDNLIKFVLDTLSQMGVTITNMVDSNPPTYFIDLDNKNLIQSVDDTLKSAYGILWVLTYGKVNDDNRNLKIDLRYNLVGEGESESENH